MRRTFTGITLGVALVALAGCSDEHTITTSDGETIITQNRPEIDENTGMIRYRDTDGNDVQIPQANVISVREN
jgi:hypothetical protein